MTWARRSTAAVALGLLLVSLQLTDASGVTFGRIVERPQKSAPWVLPMYIESGTGSAFICSSVLIHPRVVLTAAHCIAAAEGHAASVRVGGDRLGTGRVIAIERRLAHPSYDPQTLQSDLGLLVLKTPVRANAVVRMQTPWARSPSGRSVLFGWGLTEQDVLTGHLRSLQVIPERADALRGFGGLFDSELMIAVGHWRQAEGVFAGACNGDSGGPLLRYTSRGRPVLIGIASFGAASCVAASPSVYTRVLPHYDWIRGSIDTVLRS